MFVNSGTYYDALYAEKNYKAEFKFLCEHIDFSLIGNIIEIGSGTGAFTILLAEQLMKDRFMGEVNLSNSTSIEYSNQSPNILCIEPSASMIEISKSKLALVFSDGARFILFCLFGIKFAQCYAKRFHETLAICSSDFSIGLYLF